MYFLENNVEAVETEPGLKPKARANIHTVILGFFSQQPKGKVLDAPAGFGHLSFRLSEMGFSVTSGEIDTKIFLAKGLECVYTDLNQRIDAPDETFDYVCCVDGLEHMTNPYKAVEEFTRVLKKGGTAVFSIPNYSSIQNRCKFLFKGYLEKPVYREDYENSESNMYNFHNSPLTITLLNTMFEVNGLEIIEIRKDKVKVKQFILLPLVLLFKLIALLSTTGQKRKYGYDLTLRNEVVLGGNTLIMILKKR